MVGDDAVNSFAALMTKLLELMMKFAEHYNKNNGQKAEQKPKVKVGEISKKNYEKLMKAGTEFDFVPIHKDKLPEFEETMKKMGGTYFTSSMEDSNNVYVAVPKSQRNLVNVASQHIVAKELDNNKSNMIVKGEKEKISESEMKITADVMKAHDIPMYSFKDNEGKYMTYVPKEFKGQYENAMNDVNDILRDVKKIEVVRYDQTAPLNDLDQKAFIVSKTDADRLAKALIANGIEINGKSDDKVRFIEHDNNIAVAFDMDAADIMQQLRDDKAREDAEIRDYSIDIVDNTFITIDKEKLIENALDTFDENRNIVHNENTLSDENSYFSRIPNTAATMFIRLNKSELESVTDKTFKLNLQKDKTYQIYDRDGNKTGTMSADELTEKYNVKLPNQNKSTDIYTHGAGLERINLFNDKKNEIISIGLDKAENIISALKEHGIKATDKMLEKINEKLSDRQKEQFGYTKETTDIKYAEVPNIGEILAQTKLSEQVIGKMDCVGELPADSGSKCCIMDKSKNTFAVLPLMPLSDIQQKLCEMGYNEMSAKQIADKVFDSYRAEDHEKYSDPTQIYAYEKFSSFDTKNAELENMGYYNADAFSVLIKNENDKYAYMQIDKGSSMADVEKSLKENFGIQDDISVAIAMKQLVTDGMIQTTEPQMFNNREVQVSQISSKYIEVSNDGKSAMMPRDSIDDNKLAEIGISDKVISDIKLSFSKAEENSKTPHKASIGTMIKNAIEHHKQNKEVTKDDVDMGFFTKGESR